MSPTGSTIIRSGLNVDRQYLLERLNLIKKQPGFETMVFKENATMQDIAWVEAHSTRISRTAYRTSAAEILSARQIAGARSRLCRRNQSETAGKTGSKEKVFDPAILSARAVWNNITTNICAAFRVIEKFWWTVAGASRASWKSFSRNQGRIWFQRLILICRLAAEEQLANSSTKRGTIIAMDPNNGEILAMASAPSFRPECFCQRQYDARRTQGNR